MTHVHEKPARELALLLQRALGTPVEVARLRAFLVNNEHDVRELVEAIWRHEHELHGGQP